MFIDNEHSKIVNRFPTIARFAQLMRDLRIY